MKLTSTRCDNCLEVADIPKNWVQVWVADDRGGKPLDLTFCPICGSSVVNSSEAVVRLDAIPINGTFSLKIIRGGK